MQPVMMRLTRPGAAEGEAESDEDFENDILGAEQLLAALEACGVDNAR